MIEIKGDLFEHFFEPNHVVGISTNGTIKRNGHGVMGRGCAYEATLMYPEVQMLLGQSIKIRGNVPCYLTMNDSKKFLILPVKHNWWEKASLELVKLSREFLCGEAVHQPEVTFHVPRLGCGNGKLDYKTQVLPLMEILPSNVVVHH